MWLPLILATLALQPDATAYVGARLIPVEGPEIADGVMVVSGGRIAAIGDRSTPIPQGAKVVTLAGKVVMPGLVDLHSHVGGPGGGDQSGAIQPDARAMDSINPADPGFRRVTSGGLTTLNVMPGSGHLMSGQTIYVKPRKGVRILEDMLVRDAGGWAMGGLKMANGTNPIGGANRPGNRSRAHAMVRQHFLKALEYKDQLEAAKSDPTKAPKRDLGMEAMVEVLEGKRVVHHHTHRADDIVKVLQLKEEFGFKAVLHHCTEARFVAKEIAKAGVPCSLTYVDAPGGKLEAVNVDFGNAAELARAGVSVGFNTDDGITDSRFFIRNAAMAMRYGLPRDEALRSLTINPAKHIELDHRIGSLKAGKDADFIVLDGDPFSVYTRVQQTYIEGLKVFDFGDPADRKFALGGEGSRGNGTIHLCCAEAD